MLIFPNVVKGYFFDNSLKTNNNKQNTMGITVIKRIKYTLMISIMPNSWVIIVNLTNTCILCFSLYPFHRHNTKFPDNKMIKVILGNLHVCILENNNVHQYSAVHFGHISCCYAIYLYIYAHSTFSDTVWQNLPDLKSRSSRIICYPWFVVWSGDSCKLGSFNSQSLVH